MIISTHMDLDQLNDRAQGELTEEQAAKLRDLLNETEYETTEDVSQSDWLRMLEEAIQE